MRSRAWRAMGLVALTAGTGATACHSAPPRQAPPELERALTRVVPAAARSVSTPSYEAGPVSASGSRQLVLDMAWGEYVAFLDGALAPDWKTSDPAETRTALTRHFGKSATGDAYLLSVENENENASGPLHVRVTVLGVPD